MKVSHLMETNIQKREVLCYAKVLVTDELQLLTLKSKTDWGSIPNMYAVKFYCFSSPF